MLGAEDGAVVVHHHSGLELVFFERDNEHLDTIVGAEAQVLANLEESARRVQGGASCRFETFHEGEGGAIENGHFRTVQFEASVVDPEGVQSGQHVFRGVDGGLSGFQRGASTRFAHVGHVGGDFWGTFQVRADKDVARIGFAGKDSELGLFSCVQADAFKGGFGCQGVLTVRGNHGCKPTSPL